MHKDTETLTKMVSYIFMYRTGNRERDMHTSQPTILINIYTCTHIRMQFFLHIQTYTYICTWRLRNHTLAPPLEGPQSRAQTFSLLHPF